MKNHPTRASRARLYLGLLGLSLWSACSQAEEGTAAIERPSFLLISLDTLRADFLGAYGFEKDSSPAIDRLAAEGTVFTDVTSAAPWTLPSHASLLSGLYPSRHGVTDKMFRLDKPTLPKLFKAGGYRTMAINNALLVGHPNFNLMEGFDLDKYEPEQKPHLGAGSATLNSAKPIIDQAISWLGEGDPEQPFFMFLHFYDAHTDFTPDAKWRAEFVGPYSGKLRGGTKQIIQARTPGKELSPEDAEWLRQMYTAEIRTLDEELARLFGYLDRSGLSEETIVVITSDHGEEYMEHGGVLHGRTHYQELLHIPLVMRGPGIPRGLRVELPVHLVDVAPTLLKLGGQEPSGMDGVDLSLSWLAPHQLPSPRFLFAEADHNNVAGNNLHRMVRLDQYKLHYDTLTGRKQLYDLSLDPGEQIDLIEDNQALADLLWAELQRFMAGETNGIGVDALSSEELEQLDALGYGESNDEE